MDKKRYLISVFERLEQESPTLAEYGAALKGGRLTENEVDALYGTVAEIMEEAASKMTNERTAVLASRLSDLRKKEREEAQNEKTATVLETFF
ncbi:MAG: hypothetical protein QMC36_08090 [Patescibacteria group bacterium]